MKYSNEKKELALDIKKILEEKKISQSMLARELGTTRASVSMTLNNLEKGKTITLDTLLAYSKVLNKKFTIYAK